MDRNIEFNYHLKKQFNPRLEDDSKMPFDQYDLIVMVDNHEENTTYEWSLD